MEGSFATYEVAPTAESVSYVYLIHLRDRNECRPITGVNAISTREVGRPPQHAHTQCLEYSAGNRQISHWTQWFLSCARLNRCWLSRPRAELVPWEEFVTDRSKA
ncbi:hypothetical protein PISMIDRAFT_688301 [Pisolithus microcarpus 441]|uniref:Uncharacterized protein n=1 Tax=Pisolithus microcarpus 441 TaxID=765257 RepID=A0A0C9Z1S9_9AGAM|nr:hypothetical protein PISMIDRAFT_688301 [Pisolithus microcarpus 441]